MIITGMAHFESVCKKKLVDWYHKNKPGVEIDLSNVFVVWACKTLQNYKCLASTTISGDGIYQKHFVYLNDYTLYVVEDISGSGVDKYHYEINFLPQYGFKVTHSD